PRVFLDQRLRLRNPLLSLDAPFEGQPIVHENDGARVPGSDLMEMIDAIFMEKRFKLGPYALDFFEIIRLPAERFGQQPQPGHIGTGFVCPARTKHAFEQIADCATDEESDEQQQCAGNDMRSGIHCMALTADFPASHTTRWRSRSAMQSPKRAS